MAKFSELISSAPMVLVDFSAEWCGPCQALAPQLKELASRVAQDTKIIKIDVDKNQDLAGIWQVSGVPTLILFREGQQVWRQSGAMTASRLEKVIADYRNA